MRLITPLACLLAVVLSGCATPAMTPSPAPTPDATAAQPLNTPSAVDGAHNADDPYLWLEAVTAAPALDWVRARNAQTEARLQSDPGYAARRQHILEVLDSREQIPQVERRGPWLYNLWRDADHPRGLWRRTSMAEFRRATPAWETVLDVDALAKAEGENWVWSGVDCLGPEHRRCLVALSRGGADATVVREFDTVDKRFVPGGFTVPEAKTSVEWQDADTVYIGTDFGPGSLTDSGYPRTIRRWHRGEALAQAQLVFEVQPQDVAAHVLVDHTPGFERTSFYRMPSFFESQVSLLQAGLLLPVDKPADAEISFWRDRVLLRLRSDWTVAGRQWAGGTLLVADAQAYLRGERPFEALFTPQPTRSLESWTTTAGAVLLTVLDTVVSQVQEWTVVDGRWRHRDVQAPSAGQLAVQALHDPWVREDPLGESYLLNVSGFLQPDTLMLARVGEDQREPLKQRPSFFDAQGMRVEQRFATSADGTRVPYFVIWPRGARADGRNPTLLYGYGGFEVSLTPWYSGSVGRVWTQQGGVFVVANIRGGGEFGPAWHQAALGAHRQRSFDDFAAVAEDLIRQGITQPERLAIQGGSNGGLLVGAVMLQRPELFRAVVCQVPLLDMQRYHLLLAGASWMAEYGNPDRPEDWAHLSRYSPYHRVQAGQRLPTVLFVTSTRDDRVHPGHARKMAARMLEQGHEVLYWENIEGGHGGAADNSQRATMMALEYTFLWQMLGADGSGPRAQADAPPAAAR